MNETWLKCDVLKGMFSDERAIRFRLKNHKDWSVWVPASEVDGEIGTVGKVKVRTFQDEHGCVWTQLPTDYRESFVVDPDDLVTA